MVTKEEILSIKKRFKQYEKEKVTPTIEELQDLADQVWSMSTDDQPYSPVTDFLLLQEVVHIFDAFARVLDPAWQIDESLTIPYEKFVKIKNQLEHLRAKGSFMTNEVVQLKEQLHDFEEEYVKDGKFVGPTMDTTSIAMGQAVLSSLLFHCYRLSTLLLEQNDPVHASLMDLYEKLKEINEQLNQPNLSLKQIEEFQDQLIEIESKRVDGKFLDPKLDFIPEGQAELNSLLEDAHDKVYEKLCALETEESPTPFADYLSDLSKRTSEFTQNEIEDLQRYILEGIEKIKLSKPSRFLGRSLTKAYNYIQQYFASNLSLNEVVDPRLNDLFQELLSIRNYLKKIRTEFYFVNQNSDSATAKNMRDELLNKMNLLREKLHEIENRKVNGNFIGDDGTFAEKGQALMNSLLEESYTLVYEIEANL